MADLKLLLFTTVFFVLLSNSMDIPPDIACSAIQSLLSFQEIARLKQSSKKCNELYDLERACPLFCTDQCSTYACARLAKNYYACSKALSHFACKKDVDMFMHVWRHHALVRTDDIIEIYNDVEVGVEDAMKIYRKHYRDNKSICKHMLKCSVKAMCDDNKDYAKMVFSDEGLSVFDLLKKSHVKKKSQDYYNPDFIFYKASHFGDPIFIKDLCGGTVDEWSFKYIITYAPPKLLLDLIGENILPADSKTKSGKYLLHYVAERGFDHMIKIILDKGAYVNCVDAHGMTPLDYATQHAYVDAVAMLLTSADVQVRFKNNQVKRVLDYIIPSKKIIVSNPEELVDREAIQLLVQSHIEQKIAHPYSYFKIHSNGYQKLHV